MADFSKMRRKQTAWPGFFSSAPVHVLPGAELDEDAEVYQRVKHLQYLKAVHEAKEETGPLDTKGPGYNPHLTDLFGDFAINPGSFTDVFGNELGIGQTLGALLGKYGPGNTPGAHNEDPGDPRGSSRTGMASDDPSSMSSETDMFERKTLVQLFVAIARLNEELERMGRSAEKLIEEMQSTNNATWRLTLRGFLNELNQERSFVEGVVSDMRAHLDSLLRGDKRSKPGLHPWRPGPPHDEQSPQRGRRKKKPWAPAKPRPDGDGPSGPSPRDVIEIRRLLAELERWGTPATDHRLDPAVHGRATRQVFEALAALRNGDHPAIFDRLGNLERQRQRALSEQAIRERARWVNPAINWGPEGPPRGRGRWLAHPKRETSDDVAHRNFGEDEP